MGSGRARVGGAVLAGLGAASIIHAHGAGELAPAWTLWFDEAGRLCMSTAWSAEHGMRSIGIYRNDGATWIWAGQTAMAWAWSMFGVIEEDPAVEGLLLAHGVEAYPVWGDGAFDGWSFLQFFQRSTTGGASWEAMDIGDYYYYPRVPPHATYIPHTRREGEYFLAGAGVWRSEDHGESWERIGPFRDLPRWERANALAGGALLSPRDSLMVVFGDSVWVGHTSGRDWRVAGRLEPGASGLDLARHPHEAGVLYAAAEAGCHVSGDGGRTWRRVLETRRGSWRTARLRGHPTEPDALYLAAGRELYHSPDRGETWRALDAGYPGVPWINDVAVDPLDPSTLYVATSAGLFSMESTSTSVALDSKCAAHFGADAELSQPLQRGHGHPLPSGGPRPGEDRRLQPPRAAGPPPPRRAAPPGSAQGALDGHRRPRVPGLQRRLLLPPHHG